MDVLFMERDKSPRLARELPSFNGREAKDPGDGRGDFVGTVGDVDDGDRAGPDEGVHGAHERVAVGGVETLAGFVEDEQAGLFDKCACQQNHPL